MRKIRCIMGRHVYAPHSQYVAGRLMVIFRCRYCNRRRGKAQK